MATPQKSSGPLKIGTNGSIQVTKIKIDGQDTKVTYRVVGVSIEASTEEIVEVMKRLFDNEGAKVEWIGGKPEYVFSRTVSGGIKNQFGFDLVAQRKFMDIINHFEEIAKNFDGC